MAKKKAGGKISQHVNPKGKRLGVKVADGESVSPGMILVRQRGTVLKAGEGTTRAKDHSIYAKRQGSVKFGKRLGRTVVSVL